MCQLCLCMLMQQSLLWTAECCGESISTATENYAAVLRCWQLISEFYKAYCEYPDYADWLMRVRGSFVHLFKRQQ